MKRKIILVCLLLLLGINSKAQTFVTIPDANFVAFLQAHYSSCMAGNQMDTSCVAIKNAYSVYASNMSISDFTGIEYFSNLQILDCSYNNLSTLSTLPNSLKYMYCNNNHLSTIPVLPNSLTDFQCYNNQLSSLPNMPDSLTYLNCENNQLASLPAMPNSLEYLFCNNNQLLSLPPLSNSLINLTCQYNQLTSLPAIPNTLKDLYSGNNLLTSLPTLSNSLQNFWCNNNLLTSLPALPNSLINLFCQYNQLTSLPMLPNSLSVIQCNNNHLVSLPTLPISLTIIDCYKNQLATLPFLPNSLTKIDCYHNQITSLPNLPNSLSKLYCDSNNIACFPIFPNSLTAIFILGNPISCLPNYVSAMSSTTLAYPLCADGDLVNNPNGCIGAKGISGFVYKDNNSNCIKDSIDQGLLNVPLKLYDNNNNLLSQTYSFSNGVYYFPYTLGAYSVIIDTLDMPYIVPCSYPGVDTSINLTLSSPLVTGVNFNIDCKQGFDVGVQSIVQNGWVFPGFMHNVSIVAGDLSSWYNLNCASGVTGQVQVSVTGPVTYVGNLGNLTPSVLGNVFTYNILDFGNVNMQQAFELVFITDTTALSGAGVCVNVTVSPSIGDSIPSNNNYQYCYNVINSYDPNRKEVYPINILPGYQDWFTYTVHFQNTGTAPAMNIHLVDTLNNNLDFKTFQVINYSHYNRVSLKGNQLTFLFPNIQLPDSTSDLEGSKGFVQYRVKPKPNLPIGTQIKNNASIYFDYNTAIVTNTTINEFVSGASISEIKTDASLNVYPNPSNGKFLVKLSDGIDFSKINIEVYNLLGELVLQSKMQNYLTQIDLSHQKNGIYVVRLKGINQSINQRVIKQ